MTTRLREWLDAQSEPRAIEQLAKAASVHPRSLYRYASGEREVPLRVALVIEEMTGGAVRVVDMARTADTGSAPVKAIDVEAAQ